jgi:hypothetical protein
MTGVGVRFAAPWDRQLRIATVLILSLFVATGGGVLLFGIRSSDGALELLFPFLIAPVALGAMVAFAWLLAPRGFALEDTSLVIERLLRPVHIPWAEIRAVAALPQGLGGAIRVGGNGGLFGYYGRYWSRSLGSFRLYATRRVGLVCIATSQEMFVLSPERSAQFVSALLARAPQAARSLDATGLRSLRVSARPALRAIALIFAAIACTFAILLAFIWGLSPVALEIVGDTLRVERRWASAVELPLAEIRKVELLAPQYGRHWWRRNGTALGAVRYGLFASRELGTFRLYAWRYGPYVLLETDRERILLTPDEPARFIAALTPRIAAPR